jgi:hypothetical protein
MPSARVQSTDVLLALRGGVIAFRERALAAVGSLRQETQRTVRWLEQEQPQYWQHQERVGYDRVASCRAAYDTCRMRTIAGHRSACIEEQVALRRAKARLVYVQEQREVIRRWGIIVADQGTELLGKLNPVERMLEYDVSQMIAAIERMVESIEAYAGLTTDGPDHASPAASESATTLNLPGDDPAQSPSVP